MQKQRSHMFVSLHQHLPGPSDDVSPNHFVFKQHPPTQQVLMHEKTCVNPIFAIMCVPLLYSMKQMIPIKLVNLLCVAFFESMD